MSTNFLKLKKSTATQIHFGFTDIGAMVHCSSSTTIYFWQFQSERPVCNVILILLFLIIGKLLTSEFLSQRRFGVLLFELRSFLDSLDGLVARSRTKQRAMIADPTQWGYWMDGFCDLLGTIFFLIGVLLICQRAMPRKIVTFNVRPLIYYWMPTRLKKNSSLALSDPDQQPFLPVTNNDSKIRPIVFR